VLWSVNTFFQEIAHVRHGYRHVPRHLPPGKGKVFNMNENWPSFKLEIYPMGHALQVIT
jgi:hypothetical protein